jgi:transposase
MAMKTMTHSLQLTRRVIGGVDTHKDVHVAAALDDTGRLLATESFPTTSVGYRRLWRWLGSHGEVVAVGVEGTGAWGAGLARYLSVQGADVREVMRPNRQHRRRYGKSDEADAIGAARAVLAGEALGTPKAGTGQVEAIRLLRIARRSAMKARTQAGNQIHAVVDTAPEELATTRRGNVRARRATRRALRHHRPDTTEDQRGRRPSRHRPARRGRRQPDRLRSSSSFAALCGVSPIDASSGRQQHHRLNRYGDRHANRALHVIIISRLRWHTPTKTYMARRLAQGRTTKMIIRCLKRHVVREVYRAITADLGHQHEPTRGQPIAT